MNVYLNIYIWNGFDAQIPNVWQFYSNFLYFAFIEQKFLRFWQRRKKWMGVDLLYWAVGDRIWLGRGGRAEPDKKESSEIKYGNTKYGKPKYGLTNYENTNNG